MADDEWQLEAVHEQFDVFNRLRTPHKTLPSTDLVRTMREVSEIKNFYLKMKKPAVKNPRDISLEILKQCEGCEDIKLSFVVIVMNIEINDSLCKIPIFVVKSGRNTKFIDMNLSVFNSWQAFMCNNDLPSCHFCFPVGGQYNVGARLAVDFAASPAAKRHVHMIWKMVGFSVGVVFVAASFFWTIEPSQFRSYHSKADSILRIAEEFIPSIRGYFGPFLAAVKLIHGIKSGNVDILKALPEIWSLMRCVNENYSLDILNVFKKVWNALKRMYNWIKEKLSYFFNSASEWAQHKFLGIARKVDDEIIAADQEAEELLEASRRNNLRPICGAISGEKIHANVFVQTSEYTNTIFKNAKTERALQVGMKSKDENLQDVTSKLLIISDETAKKHGKSLQDVQDIFEALSDIVIDEYKNQINLYTNSLSAAREAVGHEININAYNRALGINGDPKAHYWMKALMAVKELRLTKEKFNENIENIKNKKEVLLLEIEKRDEDDIVGCYRLVGVDGEGEVTAEKLIKALKKIKVNWDEKMMVTNQSSSNIFIRAGDLAIAAVQKLNTDNTSLGIVLIVREGF